ncbi:hypothetical protein BT63DRAFT_426763 [Microthyrium microscopicum]|uniref:Uncharacterized protein n=1 Tax=Microthyrium microscopicum TaxID=703497 RepID=A0A6A6U6N0_9PEZI|nr:hypothetical protein BT63DRAFT_426763 [Microthyrium microscopicum]
MSHPETAILYASPDDRIFVIDIPTSIQLAQGRTQRLLSQEPRVTPYPSIEPKTAKARTNVLESGQDISLFTLYNIYRPRLTTTGLLGDDTAREATITNALTHISNLTIPFLHPRATPKTHPKLPPTLFPSLLTAAQTIHAATKPSSSHDKATWAPWTPHHINNTDSSLPLYIRTPPPPPSTSTSDHTPTVQTFTLPPNSSTTQTTLPLPTPTHAPTPTTGFHLITLDAPWPNRSARRAHHYATTRLKDVRTLLSGLNLDAHMAYDGRTVVGVWVTNSLAVREIVCGESEGSMNGKGGGAGDAGWLAECGLRVFEEWVWVKTTSAGEAVCSVESVWRKPYEIFVLAREFDGEEGEEEEEVVRRVIFGCADLHSRKPHLKELLERVVDLPDGYEGLEIFARGATAGWHAWGDEALLFNWDGFWE